MIRDEVWRRLAVPPRRLTVNETVLLDGDTRVRFVETGAIAVYCVEVEEDEVAGPRRFLTKFGAGQGVFSANLERPNGLRLMFVPTEETVVREVELEALWADAKNHGTTLGPLVDGWVRFLTDGIGGPEAPTLSTKLDADTELTLEEGEVLAAGSDDVRWVKMVDGTLHCFGAENLALLPNQAYFPVAGPIWVRSVGATRTAVRRSESLGDWRQLSDGIWRLHSLALAFLQSKLRQEAKAELERLEERERTQARRTEEALETLAAVLDPKSARARREARDLDPLLAVMMLVGEAVGVEIRPPRVSESAGSGVDPIEAIARASQIRTRRVTLNAEWWKSDCGPILGFSADGQRPLAVIRERSGYRVHDPIDRTWRKVDAKVAAEMLPEGVTVYRRLPEGPVDLLGLLKFAARGRGRDLVMVLLIGMGATVLGMIVPIAMRLLMDQAIPDADRRLLMEIGGGLLAVAVGQVLFQLAQGLYMIRVQFSSEADTQAAVWDRLLRLRPAFFRNFSSGDLQSRVMAVDAIGNAISGVALSSLFSGFLALMNLGLLYYYSAQLSLIAVGIAALVAAVTIVVSYFIRANTRELLDIQGLRYGLEVQLISGVGKLRVGGAGGRAFNHWMKSYSRQMGLWAKNFQLRDGVTLFNQLIPTASSILLFYFAHELLSQGRSGEGGMTLGVFLAFSAAYGTFLSGTTRLTGTIVSLMDTLVKARRLEPILSAEPEIDTEKSDPGRLTGEMAVTDAFFRYEEDGPDILRGVTFRAEPGEFVAIVGPSGSGKSTLMRLLLGFEAPQSGSVTFDHQDLVSLDVLAVRRQLGVVLQGGKLDAGTVFENISSGNVITLDQAWAAAEDAGLADDVRDMPMGMHTIISVGGDNLSGGQRQRLLIARALVQRPKILLFDEATSALDNRTQAIVSESLERLNVTRIVIAHRLSTIRNADRIYVVEAGRAVQSGRFDELIEDDDGLFARMMKRQMA